jgi:hypothetical protein
MTDGPAVPPRSKAETAAGIGKALVAAIPYVGGPLVELLNLGLRPLLESRRDAFLSDLASQVASLESRAFIRPDDLVRNEVFLDVALQATVAATKTRSTLKRDALRNAVINSLLPSAPEADVQEMFIGFVDAFTPSHLAVLGCLSRDPSRVDPHTVSAQRAHIRVGELIEETIPVMQGKAALYEQLVLDLQARGLLGNRAAAGRLIDVPWGLLERTPLGLQFVAFIADPFTKDAGLTPG